MMTLETPQEHLAVSTPSPSCGVVSLGMRILGRNIICEDWCEHSQKILQGNY